MRKIVTLPKEILSYLQEDFETLDLNAYKPISDPKDKPAPAVIKAPTAADRSAGFTVLISREPTFCTSSTFQIKPGDDRLELYNLFTGATYYCRFLARSASGVKAYDRVFQIVPPAPRMIYVEGINNVRDAGGWENKAGRLFRQGLLYRGSELNLIGNHTIELTQKGKETMLGQLGIKTDLDLRNEEESGFLTHSPLGEEVTYIREPVLGYMDIFKDEFKDRLRSIFNLFARSSAYPIYIHCWAGADRTGTVIALLKAALGFSYEVITRDYELSTFSIFGVRGRCNKDFTYVEVFEHLKNHYPGATLQDRARAYLQQELNISSSKVHAMESILLEQE